MSMDVRVRDATIDAPSRTTDYDQTREREEEDTMQGSETEGKGQLAPLRTRLYRSVSI